MSDDSSFPTSSHHHDAQGHDGKDHVSVASGGSGQTQSLDRALRPASASSVVATATARQHSLGRNQPHHHHHHPPPLAGLANQNGARTNSAKEAKYTHTHMHSVFTVSASVSCMTFDLHLSSVTIRFLQHPPHHRPPSCRQRVRWHSPTAQPTPPPWQRPCTLQPFLVTKVTGCFLTSFITIGAML